MIALVQTILICATVAYIATIAIRAARDMEDDVVDPAVDKAADDITKAWIQEYVEDKIVNRRKRTGSV